MLTVNLGNVAIVVLSEGNNPRLLNPDFLERNEIVPKEWSVENVLVTPPFAQVDYANGLQILVEEHKLQFTCSQPGSFDWIGELPRIASLYLKVLPHVSYRAVGLNFNFKCEDLAEAEAKSRLIDEMLKEGPWLSHREGITGTVLELQYRSFQPNMNVKISVVEEAIEGNGKRKLRGFMLSVNFHHDFQPEQEEERLAFINNIEALHDESLQFFKMLPL